MKRERVIERSAEGVTIRDQRGSECRFEWRAVSRIETYKLDLLSTDAVCLEFVVDGRSCVADEEATGWEELIAEMEVGS